MHALSHQRSIVLIIRINIFFTYIFKIDWEKRRNNLPMIIMWGWRRLTLAPWWMRSFVDTGITTARSMSGEGMRGGSLQAWFKGLWSDDALRLLTRRNIISRLPAASSCRNLRKLAGNMLRMSLLSLWCTRETLSYLE